MKFSLLKITAVLFTLVLSFSSFGQTKNITPTADANKSNISSEAEEAFEGFDFAKISINPNNLSQENIKDLRNNFLLAVRPLIIEKGKQVERLNRIAEPIFLLHKITKSQIIVFEHQLPTVFTWKETFITFSTGAMDILSDDEVAALVAHEIGHLYFAEALGQARDEKNDRLMRIIELKCDLAALTALSKLSIKPAKLISAVKKLIAGRDKLQIASFEPGSPSLANREKILGLFESTEKIVKKEER